MDFDQHVNVVAFTTKLYEIYFPTITYFSHELMKTIEDGFCEAFSAIFCDEHYMVCYLENTM